MVFALERWYSGSTGFSPDGHFEEEEPQSSLYQPHTNVDALCDLVVNLYCLIETCMGGKLHFSLSLSSMWPRYAQ